MKKIAFIFSGRGSLLPSVYDGLKSLNCDAQVALVVTNNPDVHAQQLNLASESKFYCLNHRDYASRQEHEMALDNLLAENDIDLLILGGYRRIFTPDFVSRYGLKTINTHPSLLPAFPGDKAQQKAIDSGVRFSGASVHLVNNEVDQGPILVQGVVPIRQGMTASELKEAIIEQEKGLINRAVKLVLEDLIVVEGNTVVAKPGFEQMLFV